MSLDAKFKYKNQLAQFWKNILLLNVVTNNYGKNNT